MKTHLLTRVPVTWAEMLLRQIDEVVDWNKSSALRVAKIKNGSQSLRKFVVYFHGRSKSDE